MSWWAAGVSSVIAVYVMFEFGYERGYKRGVIDGERDMRDRINRLLYGTSRG